MNWKADINGFRSYLKLERSLSENSIEAYIHDVVKFVEFMDVAKLELAPTDVTLTHFQQFTKWVTELGMSATTQSRVISGLRAFYKYLLVENMINNDPTELLETPRNNRKLPDTLSVEEIDKMLKGIDLSTPTGQRNRAMLETLYSSGLRVSELVDLKISNLFFEIGFLKVIGKGDKERLVPIGAEAMKFIEIYRNEVRVHLTIRKDSEDVLFLNNRGNKLTRVMVFYIVRNLAASVGIRK